VFFDNGSRILVITQSSKLCMAQMVDLRFTLHLFMTWATNWRAQRPLRVDQAQR